MPSYSDYVCGSDGYTYQTIFELRCEQKKGENVRFVHDYMCFPWETIGISSENFLVSEIQFDSIRFYSNEIYYHFFNA